ncbi:hypothetical protein UlMin_029141 [Ulmus minor]
MLLYLPVRRYILQKDIFSRKLYVTPNEIVYKFSRPLFIPFCGITTIERHIPLNLVIDFIIEQGCLQSKYGIHTSRIESVTHGKATPVDELQIQGVSEPSVLRKVIITEASKTIQDVGKSWKPIALFAEGESMAHTRYLTKGPAVMRSPVKSLKSLCPIFYLDLNNIYFSNLYQMLEEIVNEIDVYIDVHKSVTPFKTVVFLWF